MRYLVTGGAGFIGSHVCEALLERGDSVVAVDDLSAGRIENLAAVAGNPRFAFAHGSVLDVPLVSRLTAAADGVVHLAADVGVHQTLARPRTCWRRNTGGASAVLAAAAARGLRTLLASSSEVYGATPPVPVPETAPLVREVPTGRRWAYAASKVFAEREGRRLHEERGLPLVVVRLFNVAGPRQTGRHGMVLPRLVEQAVRGEDMTVHGDGRQQRCFCDVDDAVAMLLGLLDHDGAVGGTFNVGGVEECSITELAAAVRASTRSSSRIRLVPYETAYGPGYDDVRRRVPDLRAVESLLGAGPHRPLVATVQRVVRHERSRSGDGVAAAG